MIIGTKCSLDLKQLEVSLSKGLSSLEFHTFYNDLYSEIDIHSINNLLEENNVKCHAVHSPIGKCPNSKHDISIGTLSSSERKGNLEIFKRTIDLTSKLICIDNPVVVSHIGTRHTLNKLHKGYLSKNDIEKILEEAKEDIYHIDLFLKENYPHIIFAIENMPLLEYSENGSLNSWYFGCNNDLVELVKEVDSSNIKTCLDICHMQTTIDIERLSNPFSNKNICDYIKSYGPTLGLIHLNNQLGLGENFMCKLYNQIPSKPKIGNTHIRHSRPFITTETDDINYLSAIISAIVENNINCPITLEILEEDYSTQPNISETIEALKIVSRNLNLPIV